jgi:hypothetical protein
MRNFDEMKALVLELGDGDFEAPKNVDMDCFIADMLRFMGDTDSELREGIYSVICELVYGDFLSIEQLHHITFSCLDDAHMFLGIGESDTDTVFTRCDLPEKPDRICFPKEMTEGKKKYKGVMLDVQCSNNRKWGQGALRFSP